MSGCMCTGACRNGGKCPNAGGNGKLFEPKSDHEQMREEIAKLRERVAVLEARSLPPPSVPAFLNPMQPFRVGSPRPIDWPYQVTCNAPHAAAPMVPSESATVSLAG